LVLNSLHIINYRNFSEASFTFDEKINCLVGKNGVGKTNVLDAMYHLAIGKSYFNPISAQNIKHNEEFFLIDGQFSAPTTDENIVCSLKKGQKKVIKRNGKIYEKLSEHVGLIPLVIISPYDVDLIVEGSETRRKFLDNLLSTIDNQYLNQLITYYKILAQRNALLKYFYANNTFDELSLSIYTEQMQPLAEQIFEKRKQFLLDFEPIFQKHHSMIADNQEKVSLVYETQLLNNSFINLTKNNAQKDRVLQYTSVGIHKDDLLFEIDEHPIKKYGSQGQQKSFLVALKLAHFEILKQKTNIKPILLLDDIFDKLDENRVSKIVKMVKDDTFGQLFITDTHPERTENIVKSIHTSYKMFVLDVST